VRPLHTITEVQLVGLVEVNFDPTFQCHCFLVPWASQREISANVFYVAQASTLMPAIPVNTGEAVTL
jgi:hypothetical protein